VGEIYTKSLRRAMTAGNVVDEVVVEDGSPLSEEEEPLIGDKEKEGDAKPEETKQQASQGRIVTLMSVDTESLRVFYFYIKQIRFLSPTSTRMWCDYHSL
jgi:hypothetical protein